MEAMNGAAVAPIGRVLGTEDATPVAFWFAVAAGGRARLDDVVTLTTADPAGEGRGVTFYGVIDQVRRRHEGVQFDSDTELVAQGLMPAEVSYTAHVLVTRLDPEEYLPPMPGDAVYLAQGEALDKALYVDGMARRLPAGVLRSGDPAYLNLEFIDGTRGAHINISGISGVATKTSYALFLLYALFHGRDRAQGQPLLQDPTAGRAVVFNVKGEDLLFLDQPNVKAVGEEARYKARQGTDRDRYQVLGLPMGPFASCALHGPPRAQAGEALVADVAQREGVRPYVWTVKEFCEQRMLPFAFSDVGAMSQLDFLLQHVEERLYRLAADQRGEQPYLTVTGYVPTEAMGGGEGGRISAEDGLTLDALKQRAGAGTRLTSFGMLVDFIEYKLLREGADAGEDDGGAPRGGDPAWTASQVRGTREALVRRLRGAQKHLANLVRGDVGPRARENARLDVLGAQEQVHVIDIHQLAPLAQMFVVGVVLKGLFGAKEQGRGGKLFVVLDELNKYAPAEGSSPIKDVLLDVAERGRSLGLILIGAQQTASEVERRIVSNAAVRVAGRLDAAESERPEYRFMPASTRLRSTILAPGTMVVHQPDVPTPLLVTFPFPAWATRAAEQSTAVSDDEASALLR